MKVSAKREHVLTAELFSTDSIVDVRGWSKGKGFQGVVKRHGFAGVGGQTHGQHNRGKRPVHSALHHSPQEYCLA